MKRYKPKHLCQSRTRARIIFSLPPSLPPLPHGQSLFHEIPPSRTCEDATISEHYCACEQSHGVDPNDTRLREAAQFVVEQLNYGMSAYPDCMQLNVEQVVW